MADDRIITFDGIEFPLPADAMDLPMAAVNAWEKGQHTVFVEYLVGDHVWKQFVARGYTMRKFKELSNAIGEQYGFESVGESSASGTSSETTSESSRQTSNGSTDSTSPVSASV